ncbi:N-acetylneuraminate synthase family protein [Thalassospira australica]|uniref:N-acetylneuraminate synthase family protein n=1 Tax=Thalassospira australica TaxID=1528106 RepID=UPI00051A267B|nr:N-acetylneuraminate synthase family protein [Thalassospira australica]
MTHSFSLAGYELQPERYPPVFLAEIGGFFGQDVGLAADMIRQIVEVGHSVAEQPMILKTEILHDPEICLLGDTLETYASKDGRVYQENYRSLIERKVLPLDHYAKLLGICSDAGAPFIVSVYDFKGADFAVEMGASSLKIASANLVHIPLIRHCASKDLPLIVDTGRSTITEVKRAIHVAREAGCQDLVVEHSPDGHPALPSAHNLNILQTYKNVLGLPVGLSDHHVGIEMLYAAIALGASVLEKGVHVAPDDLDIDISHTMDINDLPQVLRSVKDVWLALGEGERDLKKPIEGVIGTSQRQCLVAAKDIVEEEKISFETVRFAFPCKGIPVQEWDRVVGKKLVRKVRAGQPLQWDDVN